MRYLIILSLTAAVVAQQPIYAQCGGQGWAGGTTCASGTTCQVQNQYYSQCLPGSGGYSPAPTTMKTITKPTPPKTSPPAEPPGPTKPPKNPSKGKIASTNGLLFKIDDETKYFAGTNAYWLGFLTSNTDIDTVFSHLVSTGIKVLRIWGFNDVTSTPSSGSVWFQSLIPGQAPVINTGANGLQRLDYAVQSAEAHGIKLIVNFVNNWDAYGGMPAYNAFFGGQHSDWYTNSAIQAQYQTYIKAVVSRYLDSPAIFAWELANEARCSGCSTDVIYNWAKTTSAYIKSLDKKHMVTLGDEGWAPGGGDGSYPFTTYEGVDFKRNLGIENLDFGTYHMYPDAWGQQNSFATSWINTHAATCAAAGKPCIFEEYGSPANHVAVESSWQSDMLSVKDKGLAGDFIWQWGDSLSGGKTADDTFTVYYGGDEWKSLFEDHVAAIG